MRSPYHVSIAALALALLAARALRADFNPAEIAKRSLPAVVAIRVTTPSGEVSGTGFVIDPSGTIITNLHVIRGATSGTVKLANGDVYDQIKVRAFDERKDLAIIQIAAFSLPTVALGNSDGLEPGQRVVLEGNPLGLEGSVSTGVVSGIRSMEQGYKVIQTDAAVNHGNSGGPMLNEKGEAVGVVAFKLAEGQAEGLNFAVPINYARGLLSSSSDSLELSALAGRLGPDSHPDPTRGAGGTERRPGPFGTAKEAEIMVGRAVAHINAVGPQTAYTDFNRRAPGFADGDLYVVVYDLGGRVLAHGQNSKMVGKVLIHLTDADGKAWIQERVELTLTKGKFWHDYRFTDPITKRVMGKSTYCERVESTAVCVGIYKR